MSSVAECTRLPIEQIDFRKYAPVRPRLVSSQAEIPPRPGELAQLYGVIRHSIALIRQCLRIIAGILWQRLRHWFFTKVVHSLTTAWALAGIGWGGWVVFIGTFAYLHLSR